MDIKTKEKEIGNLAEILKTITKIQSQDFNMYELPDDIKSGIKNLKSVLMSEQNYEFFLKINNSVRKHNEQKLQNVVTLINKLEKEIKNTNLANKSLRINDIDLTNHKSKIKKIRLVSYEIEYKRNQINFELRALLTIIDMIDGNVREYEDYV